MLQSRLITTVVAAAAAALSLGSSLASAATPLSYEVINDNSLASAMMLGLINENFVFIMDKVENNRARVPGYDNKPVWGSILNLNDNTVTAIDVNTNPFCASGITLGNGTWVIAGGNQAISYGGIAIGTTGSPTDYPYQNFDGRKALRLLEPVPNGSGNSSIVWLDTPGAVQMQSDRWYPGIESLADGSMVLIGGAISGGYINRNYPNVDPAYSNGQGTGSLTNIDGGGSNPTYEFFPSKGDPVISQFMVNTSGLNMYAHTFLMPSGKIFAQANFSTMLWDYTNNVETYLPDMPDEIVRVYPASGAVAMLPLTPDNNYTPTILFCGGQSAPEGQWGDFTAPYFNPLTRRAAAACHSIQPENADGSINTAAQYVFEENLPVGRTMGQFIQLPTGQMLIVNGAANGTAGYGNVTTSMTASYGGNYPWSNVFFNADGTNVTTESMTQEPQYTPVLYDPAQPQGSRLTQDGFGSSTIARLYHSSAILLPDGSVLIGGSNPHMDVTLNMPQSIQGVTCYNTTYELEKWYPDYFFETRPQPTGLPTYILYGGDTWSFTVDSDFMGSNANYKAENTKVMIIRPGFSTHAMNMGQRSLQLQHSFTVNDDGSTTYNVMPMPTNVNLFPPGPALLFITIDGIPSPGKYIQIGQQAFGGTIPYDYAGNAGSAPTLPSSVTNAKFSSAATSSSSGSSFGTGAIIGVAVGAAVVILLILLGLLCWRRQAKKRASKGMTEGSASAGAGTIYGQSSYRDTPGGEYKRVNTPSSSVHAFAAPLRSGTPNTDYDSYRMNDVSGPNTPFYDHPRDSTRSPLAFSSSAQSGWGEHHGGDAGDYYKDNMDRSEAYDSYRGHRTRQ